MKHLFFVAVAIGIFSGTSKSVEAQANINLEHVSEKTTPKPSPKFIENIEISPLGGYDVLEANESRMPVTSNSSEEIVDYAVKSTSTARVTTTTKKIAVNASVNTNTVKPAAAVIENCSTLQFKYAMMMDMEVEALTNLSLYNFIEEWWATRYQYGGTGKSGIDCSAFTGKLLATVFSINAPRTARDQYEASEKITKDDLQEGDLVFFNTRGGVSHVGLYLGNNYFVHSSVHSGVTITNITDNYYSRKFICGGRIKK